MSAKTKNTWKILLLSAAFCLVGASNVCAQDDAAPRRLWDGAFLKKRAEAKTTAPARKTTAYRRASPKKPAPTNAGTQGSPVPNTAQNQATEQAEGEMIGLTIWRLRPSRAADSKDSRLLLVDDSSKEVEWTPERVEADTIFDRGDQVRLSIESPRNGYLYVIDREIYTNGKTSEPYLIFPALNIRNGDNSVAAGKIIELPSDHKSFKLGPTLSNPNYAGEHLTILVTTEPLKVEPGKEYVKLNEETVAQWESKWGAEAERFELIGGAGKPYTKAEKEAGQNGSRALTQNDAMPQTLYHVGVKQGAPLLVKVPLRTAK